MDISVTIHVVNLRFPVYIPKIPLKGKVSKILYFSPGFNSMAKNG